jgi:type I restriction enzyme S subunit
MAPEGWTRKKLENVAELQRGFDLPSTQRVVGSVPIVSSGGISGYHNEAKVSSPGIVTGRYGSIGDVFFIEEDYWPLNTALWVKNFHNNDPKYLYYLLSRIDYKKFSDKTGVPGVNRNDLHAINVIVPPFSEQKKIAKVLSTWDKAITTTEKLLANNQQQKKALMQQLLFGKWRLPEFRSAWQEIQLKNLLSVRQEKQTPSKNVPLYSLTIEDGITPKTERYNREALVKDKDSKKYKIVKPNDIVFNPANLRWGAINISKLSHDVVVSPIYEVLFIRDSSKTSASFLAQSLMSSHQIAKFAAMTEGTLVERQAVKIEPFLAAKVYMPDTLEEQQKIAQVLTNADLEIEILQQKLACLKQEKTALMQQLLTGKRRVKVDET